MTDRSTVVYVVREHPQSGVDELVAISADEVARDTLDVVRELGEEDGTRYLHATVSGPGPEEWADRWETLRPGASGPFVGALVRRRAVVYATREHEGQTQLLTIDAVEYPDEPMEVPAGRIDHGETLEEGMLRELAEETGLTRVRVVRELPEFECTYRTFSHNHAFHVVVEEETPDEWEHRVVGKGVDAGMTHRCRWVRLTADLRLWGARDPMLAKLQG